MQEFSSDNFWPFSYFLSFFDGHLLSLLQIHAGGSTIWLYQVTKQFCPFSCFPIPKFLSVDSGILVLHPTAWCNYVCKPKYKPLCPFFICKSGHTRDCVSFPLGRYARWRQLNIENVITNDSFHCPPAYELGGKSSISHSCKFLII